MLKINSNYSKIKPTYLFAEIAHRVAQHKEKNPEAQIIRLGIGDVTEPLCPAVVEAMHRAVEDEAHRETFHGYGPEQGYQFLRDKQNPVYPDLNRDQLIKHTLLALSI